MRFAIFFAILALLGVSSPSVCAERIEIRLQREGLPALIRDQFCDDVEKLYKKQRWGKVLCRDVPFEFFAWSVDKRPLVFFETGEKNSPKLTLLQCGIHGDELPALPMCLNLIAEIISEKKKIPVGTRLIVMPLLNPDGMFRKLPSRTNARGVDINRNFPTKDWIQDAMLSWEKRDKKDSRKFPGHTSHSEPETKAIVDFVDTQKPQKIISIHTPLGFLDLDASGRGEKARRAQFLAINMSKNSGNYLFRRFGFYPGSLGNWAGQERQIPVYTLELPKGDGPETVDAYWTKFRVALWRAIDFDLDTGQFFED